MDNVFLQDAIKRRPKQAATHRNQFKLGMAMLAFSLVQQDFTDKAKASPQRAMTMLQARAWSRGTSATKCSCSRQRWLHSSSR